MKRQVRCVCFTIAIALAGAAAIVLFGTTPLHAAETTSTAADAETAADSAGDNGSAETEAADTPAASKAKPAPAVKLPEPKGVKRLHPEYDVWIDPKNKAVIVDGQISLREGMLEMFACTRNTKEHESIVSANTRAQIVHAGLLAIGAEPGRPVQFVPKYRPPSGTEIEVTVEWRDEKGKMQRARAQDWIKDINTKKSMTHPFVFAGSSFWVDEETKQKFYQAEAGDFICVSNFSTAMLDIPVESSPENSELAFEAFTEHIPPLGAPVRLILKPKLKDSDAKAKASTGGESSTQKGTKATSRALPEK